MSPIKISIKENFLKTKKTKKMSEKLELNNFEFVNRGKAFGIQRKDSPFEYDGSSIIVKAEILSAIQSWKDVVTVAVEYEEKNFFEFLNQKLNTQQTEIVQKTLGDYSGNIHNNNLTTLKFKFNNDQTPKFGFDFEKKVKNNLLLNLNNYTSFLRKGQKLNLTVSPRYYLGWYLHLKHIQFV